MTVATHDIVAKLRNLCNALSGSGRVDEVPSPGVKAGSDSALAGSELL
jgi:hypothetical protein